MKNYLSANGAGDTNMASDILTSEVAKQIVSNPEIVVDLLNEYTTEKVAEGTSAIKLGRLTSDALFKSKGFATAIAEEIVADNGMAYSGEGDTQPTTTNLTKKNRSTTRRKIDYSALLQNTSSLVSGLGRLFGGKKGRAQLGDADAQQRNDDAKAALLEKIKALRPQKTNVGMYVAVAVGISAVIGTIIYVATRR